MIDAENPTHSNWQVNVAGGWAGGDIAASKTLLNAEEMWRMNMLSSLAAAHLGARCVKPGELSLYT